MSYILHRLDADGDVALAAGPYEILRVDTRTGEVLARAEGYHTDVELVDGGVAFGLHLTPGNPATVALRLYDDQLRVAGEIAKPTGPLAAYGGRIVAGDGLLYWQLGDIVRVVGESGILRDVTLPSIGSEIGAIGGGFVALVDAGRKLVAYDSDGTQRWTIDLPVRSRKLVASPGYVVAWSGALRDSGGNLYWPVQVRDSATGAVVYEWEDRGRNILRDVALDGDVIYVLRTGYRDDGPTQDVIEVRDLRTGEIGPVVTLPGIALQIDATSSGLMWVSGQGFGLVPASELGGTPVPDPEPAPFDQFLAAHPDLDAQQVMLFQLFGEMANFTRVAQYEALLALLGG